MAKKCYTNFLMKWFFWGREDEDEKRQKNGQT